MGSRPEARAFSTDRPHCGKRPVRRGSVAPPHPLKEQSGDSRDSFGALRFEMGNRPVLTGEADAQSDSPEQPYMALRRPPGRRRLRRMGSRPEACAFSTDRPHCGQPPVRRGSVAPPHPLKGQNGDSHGSFGSVGFPAVKRKNIRTRRTRRPWGRRVCALPILSGWRETSASFPCDVRH